MSFGGLSGGDSGGGGGGGGGGSDFGGLGAFGGFGGGGGASGGSGSGSGSGSGGSGADLFKLSEGGLFDGGGGSGGSNNPSFGVDSVPAADAIPTSATARADTMNWSPPGKTKAPQAPELPAPQQVSLNQSTNFIANLINHPSADTAAAAGLSTVGMAGQAPSFIAERPLAALGTIGSALSPGAASGVNDAMTSISKLGGGGYTVGGLFNAAGQGLNDVSGAPEALYNAAVAPQVVAAFQHNASDPLVGADRLLANPPSPAAPGIFGIIGNLIGNLLGGKGVSVTTPKTWGDIQAEYKARGWTTQDVQDIQNGKSIFDFADRRISSSKAVDMLSRVYLDPTNIAFATGLVGKAFEGVGLFMKARAAGFIADAALPTAEGVDAIATGADATGVTLPAVAHYLGDAFKAGAATYKKVAIATTVAEVGARALENTVLAPWTQDGGPLAWMRETTDRLLANRPLSTNQLFSLWAATRVGPHETVQALRDGVNATTHRLFGSAFDNEMILAHSTLPADAPLSAHKADVYKNYGGVQGWRDYQAQVILKTVFDKMPAYMQNMFSSPKSAMESEANAAHIDTYLSNTANDMLAKGRISVKDTIAAAKDFYQHPNGDQTVSYQWDPQGAADVWNSWKARAFPLYEYAKQLAQQQTVIGYRDSLTVGRIANVREALKIAATGGAKVKDQVVPAADFSRIMRLSQGLAEKDPWFTQKLAAGEDVPLPNILGKLRALQKNAPTDAELLHPFALNEQTAPVTDPTNNGPVSQNGITPMPTNGMAAINISRFRAANYGIEPATFQDAVNARGDPAVQAFEKNATNAILSHGYNLDETTQAIGGWNGGTEPATIVRMNSNATIPEIRLLAAQLGQINHQDVASWSIWGDQMRSVGVKPNSVRVEIQLPSVDPATLSDVTDLLVQEFPSGFTLDDTHGVVTVMVKDAAAVPTLKDVAAKIENLYPKDNVGENGVVWHRDDAYSEMLSNKRSADAAYTYNEVFRNSRADPRAGLGQFPDRLGGSSKPSNSVSNGQDSGTEPLPRGRNLGVQPPEAAVIPERASPFQTYGIGEWGNRPDLAKVTAEPGYIYHATNLDNARGIAEEGLQPHDPTFGEQLTWPDGSIEHRAYFSREPEMTANFAPADGQPVLLRAAETPIKPQMERGTGDLYSTSPVAAANLEIYGGDGLWHPLVGYFDDPKGVAPAPLQPALEAIAPVVKSAYPPPIPPEPVAPTSVSAPTTHYEPMVLTKETLPQVPVEPGYLYHITQAKRADMIAEQGLVPLRTAGAPEGTPAKSWWGTAPDPKYIQTGREVILRAKQDESFQPGHGMAGPDATVFENRTVVPPENIEQLGTDGQWHPLTPTAQATYDPLPDNPSLAYVAAQDIAAAQKGLPASQTDAALLSRLAQAKTPEEAATADTALQASRAGNLEAALQQARVNAARDAEAARQIPLPHFNQRAEGMPDEWRQAMASFERQLIADGSAYTLTPPPKLARIPFEGQGSMIDEAHLLQTRLGESLRYSAPGIGKITRFYEWLHDETPNSRLGAAAKDALSQELLSHGATPQQISRFQKAIREETRRLSLTTRNVRLFRNASALPPNLIKEIAFGIEGDPKAQGIFPQRVMDHMGGRDEIVRVMDRASNRFMRTMHTISTGSGVAPIEPSIRGGLKSILTTNLEAANAKGQLARAVENVFAGYQQSAVGNAMRLLSKTMYPIFRYYSDIRWWGWQLTQAHILGGLAYGRAGFGHAGEDVSPAVNIHQGVERGADINQILNNQDYGYLWQRNIAGTISSVFDAQRQGSEIEALRAIQKNDPFFRDLQTRFGPNVEDIAQGIDNMLYQFDTVGAKQAVTDAVQHADFISEMDKNDPQLQALLTKLWQQNDATYKSIVKVFEGNPNRANWERMANSPWLFWPLSYQIQATHWLWGVLTDKAFGRQTNLTGAYLWSQMLARHQQRMATDPGYAQIFTQHPTLWYMAQMILPITPETLGLVTLSKPLRYAGAMAGLWPGYKAMSDPLTAAASIALIGPNLTVELLSKLGGELFKKQKALSTP